MALARKVSEPTYKRYIVVEVPRFSEVNHGYSRAIRGEFGPSVGGRQDGTAEAGKTAAGQQEAVIMGPYSGAAPPHQRAFRFDAARGKRRGCSRTDYALRWAGRALDYSGRKLLGRETEPTWPPVEIADTGRIAAIVKKAARWFGADLVGITALNRSWVYSHRGDYTVRWGDLGQVGEPLELPEYFTNVVVMGLAMDYETNRRSPAVETATDLTYSRSCFATLMLGRFIQELGYHALPSENDTALSIPLAVDAGLGELGRNGLLITERFGPRVRIGKVFTDMPLLHDRPVDLGVQAFCEVCRKCAEACPSGALATGERTADARNVSVNTGLLKWPVNPDRCYPFWLANGIHCAVCIRACPFNKPDTAIHGAIRRVAAHVPSLDRLLLWADDRLGYGKQVLGDSRDELF
jgi:reductive dehalogenase